MSVIEIEKIVMCSSIDDYQGKIEVNGQKIEVIFAPTEDLGGADQGYKNPDMMDPNKSHMILQVVKVINEGDFKTDHNLKISFNNLPHVVRDHFGILLTPQRPVSN